MPLCLNDWRGVWAAPVGVATRATAVTTASRRRRSVVILCLTRLAARLLSRCSRVRLGSLLDDRGPTGLGAGWSPSSARNAIRPARKRERTRRQAARHWNDRSGPFPVHVVPVMSVEKLRLLAQLRGPMRARHLSPHTEQRKLPNPALQAGGRAIMCALRALLFDAAAAERYALGGHRRDLALVYRRATTCGPRSSSVSSARRSCRSISRRSAPDWSRVSSGAYASEIHDARTSA